MDEIPRWGWWVIGFVGALICAIGAFAAGIQIFKGVYATLLHCVGFLAMVTFAVAVALPLSPAFMLCFASQKTEAHGRNFVNFMLSMVFSSMGLAFMVTAIGFLLGSIRTAMVSQASMDLLKVQTSTDDIGSFLFACLCYAGGLMVAGMAVTFIADFAKKGARRQLPLCIGDNYTRASGVAPNR